MNQPTRAQWVVLWLGVVWTMLVLAAAEEQVVRGVFAGALVTGLAYWQLGVRAARRAKFNESSVVPSASPQTSAGPLASEPAEVLPSANQQVSDVPSAADPGAVESPSGVAGWLVLPIFSLLVVQPIVGGATVYQEASKAASRIDVWAVMLVTGAYVAWCLYVGIALVARWNNAPKLARIFFATAAILLLVLFFSESVGATAREGAGSFGSAIASFLWFVYFKQSKRVRATYAGTGAAARIRPLPALAISVVISTLICATGFSGYHEWSTGDWTAYRSLGAC